MVKYFVGRKGILDPYILTWKDLKHLKTSKKKKKHVAERYYVYLC